MTSTQRSEAAVAARLGPHLMMGGACDGERREVDALVTEYVETLTLEPMVGDKLPSTIRETYLRRVVEFRDIADKYHCFYVYVAYPFPETPEILRELIAGYRRTLDADRG